MKKIATLAALVGVAAVMLAPVHASAESAELRITGTIVPTACTPAFAGGGVVDYGTISARSLNPVGQTTLAEKSIQLTLTCEASAMFAFKVLDDRAGTAVTSLETIPTYTANMKFGLGASDGKNIGAYSMQIVKETADEGPTQHIHSADGGSIWTKFAGGLTVDGGEIVAFSGRAPQLVPGPHASVTADIRVVAVIDQGSHLPLTQKIPLDGLSTFELVYL
ncbi:MAG: DUF1120 domain-containing protein [Variovorax sp.]|nr:DUF1120 domain-containing protein [Variovorax sp.]